jgi:hypothetical protein
MNRRKLVVYSALFVGMLIPILISAQDRSIAGIAGSDARGAPELIVCSQNLENYGVLSSVRERVKGATQENLSDKEKALIARFEKAQCDVIAVQELLAKNAEDGKLVLEHFALLLRRRTGRIFEARAGDSQDGLLRVGMLVAKDRADIINVASYVKVELPKLSPSQKPRYFARGPLEVQLDVKPAGEGIRKTVTLITFHFKSRSGAGKDPSGLEWETYRLEEAEALRRIMQTRHAGTFTSGESILIALGDRNSNFDMASAQVLQGALVLKDFQGKGRCRLSKRGVALCMQGATAAPVLFSALTLDPETKVRPGTYIKNDLFGWIDDILLPQESLRFAASSFDTSINYASGVIYEPKNAADHALVYTTLNW